MKRTALYTLTVTDANGNKVPNAAPLFTSRRRAVMYAIINYAINLAIVDEGYTGHSLVRFDREEVTATEWVTALASDGVQEFMTEDNEDIIIETIYAF